MCSFSFHTFLSFPCISISNPECKICLTCPNPCQSNHPAVMITLSPHSLSLSLLSAPPHFLSLSLSLSHTLSISLTLYLYLYLSVPSHSLSVLTLYSLSLTHSLSHTLSHTLSLMCPTVKLRFDIHLNSFFYSSPTYFSAE